MTAKKFYITTPLYYVNAKPHIGHAYTNVLCDAFSRFKRFQGQEVFFLTGTDEHGTKIEKIAREQGKEPVDFVDEMVPHFKKMWEVLDIRYDKFIRTTDEEHKKSVTAILQNLVKTGDIYQKTYSGWYCTPCESFWTELQLKEGKCPDCHREVQQLEEKNYFFKLSQHQAWLVKTIQEDKSFIQPEMRRNEILGFLREPLEDLCITRPKARLNWGIPFAPDPEFVVYVWFDALINYVSAIGYPENKTLFDALWPADVHMVGKDILRQHAVYWPIMLKAMGLGRPRTILAHGWWMMSGTKVSKSRGNAVDPLELVRKYSVDAFRYFLMNEVTLGSDGTFSEDLLAERYTTQLANDLGNLWFRYASMLDKYFGGLVPDVAPERLDATELYRRSLCLYEAAAAAVAVFDPRLALDKIFAVITLANQFVENQKPWALAKDPARKPDLELTLAVLGECNAHVACILQAFLPVCAKAMLERMGLPAWMPMVSNENFSKSFLRPGVRITRGEPLFPKLEDLKPQAE